MRAVGDRGAEHDDVGNNPETLAREGRAGVPEPRGFVEYEQKPVRVADRTKVNRDSPAAARARRR